MSFKDGIPLLQTFEDGQDSEDDDFIVDTSSVWRIRSNKKKHLCFGGVIIFAILAIIALAAVITVPVVLLQSSGGGGGEKQQGNSTTSSIQVSATLESANTATISLTPSSHTRTIPSSHSITRTEMPTLPSPTPAPPSQMLPLSSSVHTVPSTSQSSSARVPTLMSTPALSSPSTSPPTQSSSPQVPTLMSTPTLSSSPPSPSPSSSPIIMTTPTLSSTPTSTPALMPTPTATPLPSTCPDGEVCSGKLDTRSYQVVTLENQLRVLLVSDPNSNISAASMDVAVGSFSDPPEVEGLAHFCEHMLFLGTKKFPDEHVYSSFLQTHGGFDNAFTSTQETNYYFQVDAGYFEKALDMFAQFFIAPLFTPNATGREMNAVNSEHEKNFQSDEWRLWQLLKQVSNPAHPFHQFSTGTIETLNKSNISEYLNDYYNSYYSANQMQLVIYGREPLANLSEWACTYFTNVTNRNTTTPTFPATSFPPPTYSPKLVYYYPVADTDSLAIYWQTSSLQSDYRNAVASFLSRYIGHEGRGSILQSLKEQNLATGLSAGTEFNTDSYSLLNVYIDLTSDGLPRVSDVVQAVFQYIRMLECLSDDDLMMMWEDYVRVSQLNFDYSVKQRPSDYAVDITQAMRVVEDPADFLGSPQRFLFNYSLIMETLNSLVPDNSVIFIGTHQLNTSDPNITRALPFTQSSTVDIPWPELNTTEPIYGTYYHECCIPTEVLQFWGNDSQMWNFSLPGPNMFVPEQLQVLPLPQNASSSPVEVQDHMQNGTALWWLQDPLFQEPRVNFYCDVHTGDNSSTANLTLAALTTLYVSLVTEVLQPYVYPFLEVGYSYSVGSSPRGLGLQFSGLSDPAIVQEFISMVTCALRNHTLLSKENIFSVVRERETNYLRNYNFTALPYRYAYQYIQNVVMERPYWRHWQLLWEMEGATLDMVLESADTLFCESQLICFALGNINQSQAISYTQTVAESLTLIPGKVVGTFPRQRVLLDDPGNYSVTLQALNPQDANSVVNVVFQADRVCDCEGGSTCSQASLITAAHLGLLDQIIGEQCFYQLRTIEQLGYVVFCFNRAREGIGSFQTVVQSVWADPPYLLSRIDSFLESFSDDLANMTDAEFDGAVDVLKSTLQRNDLTLADQGGRFWSEISTGRLQFDYNHQLVSALDTVNLTTLQNFYCSYIVDPSSYKKLVIAIHGVDKDGDIPDITYELKYEALNQSALHYP